MKSLGAFLNKNKVTIGFVLSLTLHVLGGAGIIPPVLAPIANAVIQALPASAPAPAPTAPDPVLQLVK